MWSRNQRSSAVRIFMRRLGLVAFLVLVIGASMGVWGVYQKEKESRALRALAENDLADLASREKKLADELARLKTDRGLEEALRKQYALAAKGEKLIVIIEPPKPTPVQATSTVFEKLRDFFWFW